MGISSEATAYALIAAALLGASAGKILCSMAGRFSAEETQAGNPHAGEKRSSGLLPSLVTGAGSALILLRWGLTPDMVRYMILGWILMELSLIDLRTYLIPDRFILAGILWWAITVPFTEEASPDQVRSGLIGGFGIGGSMLVLTLIFNRISGKESMGGGDIKLFFMTGLYLGLLGGLMNLLVSSLIGLVQGIAVRREKIPFGPAISLGTMICLMTGGPVISWYLGFL